MLVCLTEFSALPQASRRAVVRREGEARALAQWWCLTVCPVVSPSARPVRATTLSNRWVSAVSRLGMLRCCRLTCHNAAGNPSQLSHACDGCGSPLNSGNVSCDGCDGYGATCHTRHKRP